MVRAKLTCVLLIIRNNLQCFFGWHHWRYETEFLSMDIKRVCKWCRLEEQWNRTRENLDGFWKGCAKDLAAKMPSKEFLNL